jgi:hypothetical protein
MNCFNHRDRPAIGLCKACAKALCAECLTELKNGLACKGSCEERVNLINRILDSNSQVLSAANRQIHHGGVHLLIAGVGFIFFGIVCFATFESSFLPYLLGFTGALTLISGIIKLGHTEQYPSPDKHTP